MPPLALLGLQIGASFLVLGIFARFVATPRLTSLSRDQALVPLLWVHTLRYVPLALLAPGQTDPDVSLSVVQTIAWGDFVSGMIAVAALFAFYRRAPSRRGWAWGFSIVSSFDIVMALSVGLTSGIHERALGVAWYVLTLYVPLVCVAQAMIWRELTLRRAQPRSAHGIAEREFDAQQI